METHLIYMCPYGNVYTKHMVTKNGYTKQETHLKKTMGGLWKAMVTDI